MHLCACVPAAAHTLVLLVALSHDPSLLLLVAPSHGPSACTVANSSVSSNPTQPALAEAKRSLTSSAVLLKHQTGGNPFHESNQ